MKVSTVKASTATDNSALDNSALDDTATTAQDVRAFTRGARADRVSGQPRRTPEDLYIIGAFIVLAIVEAVGLVSAPGHSAAVLGGRATAEWFLTASDPIGAVAALLLALFATLFALTQRIGPVVMTLAQAHWWLPLPVDRRGLVLPGYLASLLVPVVVLSVGTAVVFTGTGGFSAGVAVGIVNLILTVASVATLAALTHSAAAWIQVRRTRQSRQSQQWRAIRLDAVVRFIPLIVILVVLGATLLGAIVTGVTGLPVPLLEWFIWLPTGWPLLAAGGAVWPVAVLVGAALLAVGLAYRGLPSLTRFSLSRSAEAGSLASEALLSMEFKGLTMGQGEYAAASQRERGSGSIVRNTTGQSQEPATGATRRFVFTQFRVWWRRGQAAGFVSAALLPVVLLSVPYLNLGAVLVAMLVVCTLRAVTIAGSVARTMSELPALGRLFPLSEGRQRRLLSVLPGAVLVPWCVLCFGLMITVGAAPAAWIWFAVPVGVGLAGAAVRSGYRPDTDWETPLISTPMGAVSSGWVMNTLHGRTAAIVVLYPALAALAGGAVTPLLVVVQWAIAAAVWWWCTRMAASGLLSIL